MDVSGQFLGPAHPLACSGLALNKGIAVPSPARPLLVPLGESRANACEAPARRLAVAVSLGAALTIVPLASPRADSGRVRVALRADDLGCIGNPRSRVATKMGWSVRKASSSKLVPLSRAPRTCVRTVATGELSPSRCRAWEPLANRPPAGNPGRSSTPPTKENLLPCLSPPGAPWLYLRRPQGIPSASPRRPRRLIILPAPSPPPPGSTPDRERHHLRLGRGAQTAACSEPADRPLANYDTQFTRWWRRGASRCGRLDSHGSPLSLPTASSPSTNDREDRASAWRSARVCQGDESLRTYPNPEASILISTRCSRKPGRRARTRPRLIGERHTRSSRARIQTGALEKAGVGRWGESSMAELRLRRLRGFLSAGA